MGVINPIAAVLYRIRVRPRSGRAGAVTKAKTGGLHECFWKKSEKMLKSNPYRAIL
jgi:hypothetical protein